MPLYRLSPMDPKADGPFAETRANTEDEARAKAVSAYPGHAWKDKMKFECRRDYVIQQNLNVDEVKFFLSRQHLPPS